MLKLSRNNASAWRGHFPAPSSPAPSAPAAGHVLSSPACSQLWCLPDSSNYFQLVVRLFSAVSNYSARWVMAIQFWGRLVVANIVVGAGDRT